MFGGNPANGVKLVELDNQQNLILMDSLLGMVRMELFQCVILIAKHKRLHLLLDRNTGLGRIY